MFKEKVWPHIQADSVIEMKAGQAAAYCPSLRCLLRSSHLSSSSEPILQFWNYLNDRGTTLIASIFRSYAFDNIIDAAAGTASRFSAA